MTYIRWFSVIALASSLATGAVQAQDLHIITPHYPDAFTVETTHVTDQEQTINGKKTTGHTQMVFRQTAQRANAGYHATYKAVSAEVTGADADGRLSPQAAQKKRMLDLLVGLEPAQVTLDDKLTPQSIDNIEALKPELRQGLTATGDAQQDAIGIKMYDAFIANLTPQSAAAFLKQLHNAWTDVYFNKPLTLHVATPLDGESVQIMGGSLKLSGSVTLDSWEDGKSATFTSVIAPSDEDLHAFITGTFKSMIDRIAQGDAAAQRRLLEGIFSQMHMSMTETCHSRLDLSNDIAGDMSCDSMTTMDMDLAKALPADMIKAAPQLAQMPPMSMIEKDHIVSSTRLIP
jgi:hypothetical protein